jgi:hypothetical protein
MYTLWGRGKTCFIQAFTRSYANVRWAFEFIQKSRIWSWGKSQFPTLPTLLAVFFGFSLKACSDTAEAERAQRAELQRAERSVMLELQIDLESLAGDVGYLDQDIAASAQNSEMVISMNQFSTVAGQTAFLKGSFEQVSFELSERVGKVYVSIEALNQRIQQREYFRFTNAAMSTFTTRRRILSRCVRPAHHAPSQSPSLQKRVLLRRRQSLQSPALSRRALSWQRAGRHRRGDGNPHMRGRQATA